MDLTSKRPEECTGCEACSHVCGKRAITMQDDGHGFRYPVIDEALCVHCGACERVCPHEDKPQDSQAEQQYYAVCHRDGGVVRSSSSGGMVTLLAEEIFARGGVMYGVAYGEGFRVAHARAESMEEAQAFRSSKYVQSDIAPLYDALRQDLQAGRTVLVTGTPCQLAGVKAWLKHKRVDMARLYTCDNICHGVTSPMAFADYLESMKKYIPAGDEIAMVNMRYKDKPGPTRLEIRARDSGSVREVRRYSYFRLFQNRVLNRPSCFACPYTSYSRQGDISVADFYNYKPSDFPFDTRYGVSEVLVNSDKGRELFEAVRGRASVQEVSREKAWQPHLEYATQKPKGYDAFWEAYMQAADREQVLREYVKTNPLFKVINLATPILRRAGLYTFFGRLYKKVFAKKK